MIGNIKYIKNYLSPSLMLIVIACSTSMAQADNQDAELREQALSLFKPLPDNANMPSLPLSDKMVALGRELFFDRRISASGSKGCANCHQPKLYGTNGSALGLHAGSGNPISNVPTVLNASWSFALNWYGDQPSIESQSITSLVSKAGLGHTDTASAMAKIRAIPKYRKLFSAIFSDNPEPVTPENWATVMGAYQRTLNTPAPFDAYLAGNNKAISANAKKGLKRFMDIGCVACHNGIGIGGSSYQKFGVWEDYWPLTKSSRIDEGRFNLTKDNNDLYVFRVAGLRNVSKTAPYFHDGSVKSLPDAVRIMGKIQLRKTISKADVKYIVAFLNTLTGKLPKSFSRPS